MKRTGVWIGGGVVALVIGAAWVLHSGYSESRSGVESSAPDLASRASIREGVEDPAVRAHRQLQASIDKAGLRETLDRFLARLRDGLKLDYKDTQQFIFSKSYDDLTLLTRAILEADDIPFSERSGVVFLVGRQLAHLDPGEALKFLDELDPLLRGHPESARILSLTVREAARWDPEGSVDWYLSRRDRFGDEPVETTARGILVNVAGNNPGAAIPLIDALQMQDRNSGLNAIARGAHTAEQMSEILEEAGKLVATAGDPATAAAMEKSALQGLASGLSGRHGAGDGSFTSYSDSNSYEFAMSWLDSAHLSPDQLRTVAEAVDPAAKPEDNAKWIDWMGTQLPPEEVALRAGPMIADWAKNAPGDAEQWLAAATEGPVRDAGIEAAVTTLLSQKNPDAAIRVAGMLPDGPKREKLLAAAALGNKGR